MTPWTTLTNAQGPWYRLFMALLLTAVIVWVENTALDSLGASPTTTGFVLVASCIPAPLWSVINLVLNPVPVISIENRGPLRPGETYRLRWKVGATAIPMTQLRVVFQVTEEYYEKTLGRKHPRVIVSMRHEDILVERPDVSDGHGEVQLRLPTGIPLPVMHARPMFKWAYTYTNIRWEIRVTGDIPWFPDVDVDFPIEIMGGT